MSIDEEPLDLSNVPYRPCVGIALFNRQGLVWTGRRKADGDEATESHRWQMPQGGIDPGEDPRTAVFRELHEETGTRDAQIIGEIEDWLTYDLPEAVIRRKRFTHRGQRQKWFALLFTGTDDGFDLHVHEPEFDIWRWTELTSLPDLIIPFKRPVYERVVAEFRPIARRLAESAG